MWFRPEIRSLRKSSQSSALQRILSDGKVFGRWGKQLGEDWK